MDYWLQKVKELLHLGTRGRRTKNTSPHVYSAPAGCRIWRRHWRLKRHFGQTAAPPSVCMILCKFIFDMITFVRFCASFWTIIFGLLQALKWRKVTLSSLTKNEFWIKGCTGFHGSVSTCLLFLCLFTFWISQSRLQSLFILLKN